MRLLHYTYLAWRYWSFPPAAAESGSLSVSPHLHLSFPPLSGQLQVLSRGENLAFFEKIFLVVRWNIWTFELSVPLPTTVVGTNNWSHSTRADSSLLLRQIGALRLSKTINDWQAQKQSIRCCRSHRQYIRSFPCMEATRVSFSHKDTAKGER